MARVPRRNRAAAAQTIVFDEDRSLHGHARRIENPALQIAGCSLGIDENCTAHKERDTNS
jgi:hypothetical protein